MSRAPLIRPRFAAAVILTALLTIQLDAFQQDVKNLKIKSQLQSDQIAKLIRELNSPDYKIREAAQKLLTKLGRQAVPALKNIDVKSATSQTLFRVQKILAAIEENASGFIDLSLKSNQKLNDSLGRFEGSTLESLPRGVRKLGGVKFKVSDHGLVLNGGNLPNKPDQIKGISINRQCGHLHFLQAMQFGTGIKDGEPIGKYVVHYDDGKQESIPIVFGEDVRDWWNADESKPVKRGVVAWSGQNPAAKSAGHSIRLYRCSWKNPRSDKKVTTIDFVQTHTVAAPFCVAITAEAVDITSNHNKSKPAANPKK